MADDEEKPYTGPDQRAENRRSNEERRQDIRFEPGKENRRKDFGRRKEDKKNNVWRGHDA